MKTRGCTFCQKKGVQFFWTAPPSTFPITTDLTDLINPID
jgi:hypothetical protein